MALDLPELHPGKKVTLVHSRANLMHQFHSDFHKLLASAFEDKGIELITQTRAKIPQGGFKNSGQSEEVELTNGQNIPADFVILATGQSPNNALIRSLSPNLINESNGFIHVKKTLQLQSPEFPHIFAVGDIADTGLHKAARPGAAQAKIAASNILSLIEGREAEGEFERSPRAIHLSMGLKRNVIFRNPAEEGGEVTVVDKWDGREDMGVEGMWERLNVKIRREEQQHQEVRAEL